MGATSAIVPKISLVNLVDLRRVEFEEGGLVFFADRLFKSLDLLGYEQSVK